jgi:hypothetical protein
VIAVMAMIACLGPAAHDTGGPDWSAFDGDDGDTPDRPPLGTAPAPPEVSSWTVSGEVWSAGGRAKISFLLDDCLIDYPAEVVPIDACMPCRDAVSGVLGAAEVTGACPAELPAAEGAEVLLGFGDGLVFAPSPEWQPAGTARREAAGRWSFQLEE